MLGVPQFVGSDERFGFDVVLIRGRLEIVQFERIVMHGFFNIFRVVFGMWLIS